MLLVSWTAKKASELVLEKAEVTRTLLTEAKKRKLRYFGHAIRQSGYMFRKICHEGDITGKQKKRKASDIMAGQCNDVDQFPRGTVHQES